MQIKYSYIAIHRCNTQQTIKLTTYKTKIKLQHFTTKRNYNKINVVNYSTIQGHPHTVIEQSFDSPLLSLHPA